MADEADRENRSHGGGKAETAALQGALDPANAAAQEAREFAQKQFLVASTLYLTPVEASELARVRSASHV